MQKKFAQGVLPASTRTDTAPAAKGEIAADRFFSAISAAL
jgi:hypothetical protein